MLDWYRACYPHRLLVALVHIVVARLSRVLLLAVAPEALPVDLQVGNLVGEHSPVVHRLAVDSGRLAAWAVVGAVVGQL